MKHTKRILHVLKGLDCGGVENFVFNTTQRLYKNSNFKFYFLIADAKQNFYVPTLNDMGCTVYTYKNFSYFGHLFNLCLYFMKIRPDVIHTHNSLFNGFTLFIAWCCGIKKRIAHAHFSTDTKPTSFKRKLYVNFSRVLINWFATDKIACSKVSANFLFKNQHHVTILYNGIDCKKYRYEPAFETSTQSPLIVGHVGRFTVPKNHIFIIDIFMSIEKLYSNSQLWLIGDGPLEDTIKQKVSHLDIRKKILFWGVQAETPKLYQRMNCFLFPSLHEGFPIALLEAQCSGLPCFISDGISQEAMFCNTTQIPLSKSAKEWAEIILEKTENFKRQDCSHLIQQAGFDIHDTVRQLQTKYLK